LDGDRCRGGGGGGQEEEAGAAQASPQAGSDRCAAQDGGDAGPRSGGIERRKRRRRLSTPDAHVPVDHRPPPSEPNGARAAFSCGGGGVAIVKEIPAKLV